MARRTCAVRRGSRMRFPDSLLLSAASTLSPARSDTEIDWIAYMQEVSGFLHGELDYMNLKGDTGPLVYPAGFVYLYSALYYLTDLGTNILRAQYIFLAIYLVFIAVLMMVYHEAKIVRKRAAQLRGSAPLGRPVLPPLTLFVCHCFSSLLSALLG